MKNVTKILSIVLSVLTVLGIFSVSNPVLAAEIMEKEIITETIEQHATQTENIKNEFWFEIEEERDKFTKVFQNANGTKTAVISSTPVHYETETGWKDIDNTLVEETENADRVYKNKDNTFTATIPQELSADKSIEIEKEGYSVSFELVGTDIFSGEKKVNGNKRSEMSENETLENGVETSFLDKTSEISFEDIGENTSVEYTVTSTGLKENIILYEKPNEEVIYKYKITAKNLTAELNHDNSVTFKNSDGQAVFEIPAPVMYDSNNKTSTDIDVKFTGQKDNYILTYTPSYEWLSGEIAFPVVIDPVINTTEENVSIKDTVVDSANPTLNYKDSEILSTYKSDTGLVYSYIDLADSYIVKNGAKIKTVLLGLYYTGGLFIDDSTTVAAYTVTSDWSDGTVTYNNQPTSVTSLIERKDISRDTSAGYVVFDVTKAYTLKEDAYGVCIRQRDTVESEAQLLFASSEHATEAQQPFFAIEYYESQGVEEQFDYHAFDVGRAGTVYYNDFTDQIYIERDELGLSGLNMPVQIKRYFNSGLGGTYLTKYLAYFDVASSYGYGWRTNYNQSIEYHSDIDGKETILYCNGDGQTTYFAKTDTVDSTGIRTWEEVPDKFSDSGGYTLYLSSDYDANIENNFSYVTIKDSSGQIYEFNSDGLLIKINSAEEDSSSSITITYAENDYKIQKITDGAGREYRFTYTEYEDWFFPLLTSIQAYSPSGAKITVTNESGTKIPYKMTYTYSFSNYLGTEGLPTLASATYPDGETVYYTLNDSLVALKNIDGYAVEFEFGDGIMISEKVYDETGTNYVAGGGLAVLDVNSYEKCFIDINEVVVTKQYDMYGRVINTTNPDGSVVARTYSDDYNAQGSVTYSFYNTAEQDFIGEEVNLVTNGSFSTDVSGWTISNVSKVKQNANYDCVTDNATPGSLQMSGTQSGIHYASQIIDIENGISGDEYRLDYFTKNTTHSHMVVDLLYFNTMLVEARNNVNGDESWQTVAYVDANSFNTNWQKYSYAFDIDFEYNEIQVTLAYYFQYGTVRFDDVSLVNTYKATVVQSSGTDTSTGTENTGSSTETTDETQCECDGCITPDCPCRECSDTCTEATCNRGYTFENTSQGTSFSITDGEKTMSMTQNVSGNYYGSQIDINGLYTGYSYNQLNGQLNSMSNGVGDVTNFGYDAMSRLNKVTNTVDGLSSCTEMITSYTYENDRVESITHNGFSYNYEYNVWGNPASVKVGEQSLVSYTYDEDNKNRNRVNRITYGNGDYTDYGYNSDGNIETLKSYSGDGTLVADYLYSYGDYSQLESIKNITENTEIRYTDSGYDFVNLMGDGSEDDITIYSKAFDENQNTVENLNGIVYTKCENTVISDSVTGETTNSVSLVSPSKTYDFSTVTDYFGRTISKDTILRTEVGNGYTGSEKLRETFEYADVKDPEKSDTTSLVSKYTVTHGTYVETVDPNILPDVSVGFYEIYSHKEYFYDYDYNGNITRIRVKATDEDGNETLTERAGYVYDNVGQLVRENNADVNKSIVYVYDKGGNIAQKKEYAYTTGELGEVVSTINYTYDSVWKDKLTAYGDTQIETDAMGNPLNYYGERINGIEVNGTLEWNGRQLSAAVVGEKRYEYTYDADGMRTSVKVYTESGEMENIYYYIWENGRLIGYYISNSTGTSWTTIKMLFDATDAPIGFELKDNGSDETEYFYFKKNLQGDITAVYEQGGSELINYYYDAWGKVVLTETSGNTMMVLLAFICTPITYRGYMYDAFTGLYYLQSRYYNATYGRFLNADSIMKTGEPLGANIFAYCGNNPVNYVDYDGRDAMSVITNIIYLLVVLAVMEADGLLERFDYIFESATSFSYKETTVDGITDLVATFVLNSSEDNFESYDINIKLAHIDTWRDWQRGIEHSSKDDHFVDIFVSTAFFFIGFLGFPGQLLSASLSIFEIYYYIEQVSTYEYIDFIHEKIEYAKNNNLEFIYFVREIKRNYINFFGNLKSETKYDCLEG